MENHVCLTQAIRVRPIPIDLEHYTVYDSVFDLKMPTVLTHPF